jgi:hypothetical protein
LENIQLFDKQNRSVTIPLKAYLENEDFIKAGGYRHARKLKTFWDVDSFALEAARRMPTLQCGGFNQAALLQALSGLQAFPVIPVVTTPITIPSPCGLYALAKTVAGVITVTVPAPVVGPPSAQGDDGKQIIWYNNQTQANIVSHTGATLLSVGVAKTTITFTAALVGEFCRVMSFNGFYVALDIVTTGGGTLA